MATPQAVGAVALILQRRPNLRPEQVKEILKQTAVNMGLDTNAQGSGRADVFQAIQSNVWPAVQPEPVPPGPTPVQPPAPAHGGCSRVVVNMFKRN